MAKKIAENRVLIKLTEPWPGEVTLHMRSTQIHAIISAGRDRSRDHEHFLCEFAFQMPPSRDAGVTIRSTPPGAPDFTVPEEFDVDTMTAVGLLHLCVDDATHGTRSLEVRMDVLCDFLGGERVPFARAGITPGRMEIVPQSAPFYASAESHPRLCHVKRQGEVCEVVYVGVLRSRTSGLLAKSVMARVITRTRRLVDQLTGWEASTLRELAWRCLEDEQRAPSVRMFAVRVLHELCDVRQRATSSDLDDLDRLIHLHWRDYDLKVLSPWVRESFFEACTLDELIERASVFEHPRLRDAIVERSSLSALLGLSSVLVNTRREALTSALHLKRSFLRAGEETLSNVSAHDMIWVTDVLLDMGWVELWSQPWMHTLYRTRIAAMTAPEHQALCARVFIDDQNEVAREARSVCEAAYVAMIHDAEDQDRAAVLGRVPVRMLLHLLARRADLDADAVEWAHLRARISSAQMMELFSYTEIKELQRLELLGQLLADERARDMILEEPEARHPLLKVFEVAGAASASMDVRVYDRIARDMLWYNEAVFSGRDELKVLEYAIKAYVRQVERQGVRKSALETVREISTHLPRKHERWVDPVIARWTEQMGAGRMAGALTHSDEGEHAGALSVTDEEKR